MLVPAISPLGRTGLPALCRRSRSTGASSLRGKAASCRGVVLGGSREGCRGAVRRSSGQGVVVRGGGARGSIFDSSVGYYRTPRSSRTFFVNDTPFVALGYPGTRTASRLSR